MPMLTVQPRHPLPMRDPLAECWLDHDRPSSSLLRAPLIGQIPRENGLVRLYISLGDLPPGQRLDRTKLTAESILESARKILHPYHLEATHIDWCTSSRSLNTAEGPGTCYEIGQRVCKVRPPSTLSR